MVPLYMKHPFKVTGNLLTPFLIRNQSGKGSANRSKQVVEFVKNLVDLMTKEDLELVNKDHNTALYLAAAAGYLETVKIMMAKNEILHTIPGAAGTAMPLHAATLYGNKDVVKFLYRISKDLSDDDGWNPANRGWLLEKCGESDMFVCTIHLVNQSMELQVVNVPPHSSPPPQSLHPTPSSTITKPSPANNASRRNTIEPSASKKSIPHKIFN
ncbi:ankyrin repeat-containing domain, PGG domain protein [Artemisia annua]|uniref:Ankyrin repeat-containing domain, PGG domain protein n=1 Tax=Artemisia annua TaxID=35608 RepID=A0A2U1M329_ARTAN|nr:ankyrin repeat-containing domain, PGG domain protein [Artemisia annua]